MIDDDLVTLLRTAAATHTQHFGILKEAADRIEALESLGRINISARDTLLARIEVLEEALQKIAAHPHMIGNTRIREIARAALDIRTQVK